MMKKIITILLVLTTLSLFLRFWTAVVNHQTEPNRFWGIKYTPSYENTFMTDNHEEILVLVLESDELTVTFEDYYYSNADESWILFVVLLLCAVFYSKLGRERQK